MNKAMIVLLCLATADLYASEVAWNTLTIENWGTIDRGAWCCAYLSSQLSANFEFYANPIAGGVELSAVKWNYSEICNAWMLAEADMLVDEAFVKGASGYFHMNNIYGNGECRVDYTIVIPNNESIYLAFACADSDTPTAVRFGWAEVALDSAGKPTVLISAFDLEGNPIVVGAIPEPTAGVLLVLGAAVLGLRRKRNSWGRTL